MSASPDQIRDVLLKADWTQQNGSANSSPEFIRLVGVVEALILGDAYRLLRGGAYEVARSIVAHLAHEHGMAPRETR